MLRFLVCDIIFIYILVAYWAELGNYIYLVMFFIAFFTFGLIYYIKQILR